MVRTSASSWTRDRNRKGRNAANNKVLTEASHFGQADSGVHGPCRRQGDPDREQQQQHNPERRTWRIPPVQQKIKAEGRNSHDLRGGEHDEVIGDVLRREEVGPDIAEPRHERARRAQDQVGAVEAEDHDEIRMSLLGVPGGPIPGPANFVGFAEPRQPPVQRHGPPGHEKAGGAADHNGYGVDHHQSFSEPGNRPAENQRITGKQWRSPKARPSLGRR